MEIQTAAEHGLLRNRPFLALWSAQILSMTAANALTSALIVLVAEITRSNTSSSFLILFAVIPAVVFGIFAGVFVGRSDRRLVLIATNGLRAAAVLVILVLGEHLATAYVVNFLVASVTVFFVPAEAATIPHIVRKRDLLIANSLFTFTFNGAFLLGFIILAPVLVAFAGFPALFASIVVMFGLAAVLCTTLPPSEPAKQHIGVDVAGEAVQRGRRDIGEALRFLGGQPRIAWSLVYIAVTYTLIAVAGALAPGYVREVLLLSERAVALLVAPAGIGGVAGLPYFIGLIVVTAFVFGLAYAFITVPSMTLVQEELPEHIRGRVFGVLNVLVSVFSLLPIVVVGPVADVWGVAPVFAGAAVLVIAAWLGGRRVRAGAPANANVTGDTPATR